MPGPLPPTGLLAATQPLAPFVAMFGTKQLTTEWQTALIIVAAPGIYLGLVVVGRWLKRAGVQLSVMYKLFAAAMGVLIPFLVLNWKIGDWEMPEPIKHDIIAVSILLGVIFFLSLLKRYLWEFYFGEKRGMQVPKFLREIFSGLFFIAALLAVIGRVYGVSPSGVVFTSTVVVGVVGWAMQDLLGNVISGVALQIGKPFKTGDWLVIENQHAEIIEVNWRSTRLRTNDDHYLDIPNSAIVRSTIVNLSYPSHLHAMRLRVGIDYDAPPNKVRQVLLEAAAGAKGVLNSPPPKVYLIDFGDSAIMYEVKYWLENHAAYNDVSDALRTAIWYSLKRAGIGIPFPMRTVQVERKKTKSFQLPDETRALIRNKPFFKCLTDPQMEKILGAAKVKLFGKGDHIVEQGAHGTSMFIILGGEAAVFVRQHGHPGEPARVAGLHQGDYFGEMSLLTGEARSATVVATTDCDILEIAKNQLAGVLQENAELLTSLSEMLAQRRLDTEGVLASSAERHALVDRKEEYTRGFLQSVGKFFQL